ncbi:MAG: ABC transporter permease [Gaiellaceae bacterium MAG52_C11]|nr:ABC transporter permease [Candidatus Gaiellasilicea maunaloa]
MSNAAVIARQQLRLLSRSHTFLLLLLVLLGMTALSGYIGWSSHSTIIRVYDETVRTLTAAGKPAPPNPFADKPRLSLLNNMIIYVPLIGALLAIAIGNMSVTGDRQAGVTRVIFSRPVRRSSYFWGKLGASAAADAAIMAACLALSVIGLTLINHGLPTAQELLRLGLFYALSGLYLLLFVLIGIVAALLTRSRSLGLFAAVAVWVLITFATPQFTSGLRPVASLNPVTNPVAASHSGFFGVTSKAKPIAVNEQYKALSTRILSRGDDVVRAGFEKTAAELAPIVLLALLLGGWAYRLVRRHDFSEEAARD